MSEQKQPLEVTMHSIADVPKSLQVFVPAFEDDPFFNWFLHDFEPEKKKALMRTCLKTMVKAPCLEGGHLLETGHWGSCAVLLPLGKRGAGPLALLRAGIIPVLFQTGITPIKRIVAEYLRVAERSKAKHLSKEEAKASWCVAILGTLPERQGQGLGSVLLRHMVAKGRESGRPIWLEASSPGSCRLYQRHGFVVVDEIVLGRGRVDADGRAQKGGEGVTTFAMVWRPSAPGEPTKGNPPPADA